MRQSLSYTLGMGCARYQAMRVRMSTCGIRAWSPIWRCEIALTDLSHMAGRQRTSFWSQGARDGSICASRRDLAIAPLLAWQGPVVGDRDRSHRSLQLQPQPWRGHCRLRAMVVASRRGGQPFKVRGSTLTHPQPIPHPYPHPRRRFCRFAACLLTPLVRLVQVHVLATLRAALRAFYFEYEYDARGYGHLGLKLRA